MAVLTATFIIVAKPTDRPSFVQKATAEPLIKVKTVGSGLCFNLSM
jgi:hypothetical protein